VHLQDTGDETGSKSIAGEDALPERVYKIAKEVGWSSKYLLHFLKKLKIEAKSHTSNLDDEQVSAFRKHMSDVHGKPVVSEVRKDGTYQSYDALGDSIWAADAKERVVLLDDLRNYARGLYAGQLGWTVPDTTDGYDMIDVEFDNGEVLPTLTKGITRVVPDKALEFAKKVIAEAAADLEKLKLAFIQKSNHSDPSKSWKNFQLAIDRYGYDFVGDDFKWIDLSRCEHFGEGPHDIVVFSFARHLRLSQLKGQSEFPLWVGMDRPDFMMRYKLHTLTGLCRAKEPTSFAEPICILAVIHCKNGVFAVREIERILDFPAEVNGISSHCLAGSWDGSRPEFRLFNVDLPDLIKVVQQVLAMPGSNVAADETGAGQSSDLGAVIKLDVGDLISATESTEHRQRGIMTNTCEVVGDGPDIVYAYTYEAFRELALISGSETFPIKVGYTKSGSRRANFDDAWARILSQIIFPEPISMIGLLACNDGRSKEIDLHRRLKNAHIKTVGREWFQSNSNEIRHLMTN